MPFSFVSVVEDVKRQLPPDDARQINRIESAVNLALYDMAARMKSINQVRNYDISVAASTRTVTVEGEYADIRYIWFVKYGTGSEQKPLEYVAPEFFVEKYDDPSVAVGTPTYYSILTNDYGKPVVKFDVPTEQADTLTVYYFCEPTQQNISRFRSPTAIITGALAYFYGKATEIGTKLYQDFKEMVALERESDPHMADPDRRFKMNKFDREVRDITLSLRDRRY